MNVSVNDDVQLKKAENAWKPGMKRDSAAEDPEMQKTQAGQNIKPKDEPFFQICMVRKFGGGFVLTK